MTRLDDAHAAMETDPDDDARRLGFYRSLAETELFLLLDREAEGETLSPSLFDTSEGRFALAFDLEDRLTAFTEGPAPYAALSGRAIAAMLEGREIGLGINLGVAPSSYLVPAGALDWLADTLRAEPGEVTETPETVRPPAGLPEALLTSLDAKLASARGLARLAYLVAVTYRGNRPGHMLAFIDAEKRAEPALARAMSEALILSGVEAGTLDIAFFAASDPIAATLARHGLRFDLPQIETANPPGSDPAKPPKLR